ncbi:hypothetical protein QTI33_27450 [Variovorax sp. J22P271]|uniref:hypothetical protein n=1 Tax=Variovorax davisae TaxID=3053515 RepID=UPI002578B5E3|nr:hypothetical protein [Variovorax sp. J22P271]MDM0035899.1 hypothetical protein [Variovorax sp. J22P271]
MIEDDHVVRGRLAGAPLMAQRKVLRMAAESAKPPWELARVLWAALVAAAALAVAALGQLKT